MRTLIALVPFAFIIAVLPVAADEVGISGGCWDEDSGGGSAFLRVNDDGLQQEGFDADDAQGIVPALLAAGNGEADTSGDTPNPCTDGDQYSYIEAHAEVGGEEAQVCYNGDVHTGPGSCPTTPPDRVPVPGDHIVRIGTITACAVANYDPDPVVVAVGETVQWENVDSCAHTATDDDGAWNTGAIGAGSSSDTIAFDTPGTYTYHCAFHPSMTGEVIVQA